MRNESWKLNFSELPLTSGVTKNQELITHLVKAGNAAGNEQLSMN